ncbi:TonB-dependent receptor [Nonlabens marinus S1-08]|uniref:TonB-dependent receptor n=2 Tax=Nonlabens TaxID=363408 RepID=W8VXF8_9FLAO|nr:TonB-dependent receptor [Nonlabens marinus S1-08]
MNYLAFSQVYKGVVLENETPILGATVSVKGTNVITQTDFDGKFEITVPEGFNILLFSLSGYEVVEYELENNAFITVNMQTFRERGIWMSIGSFSDLSFAPYGISISNGQEEQNLMHFESFQEKISLKLAIATDFADNLTYETKFTYYNSLFSKVFFNNSIEYIKKDYSNFQFEAYNLSSNVTSLNFINSLLTTKIGIQSFNNYKGFGGAIGIERHHYNLQLQYGAQLGYWNKYLTYAVYYRMFLINDKLSFIANYDRINRTNFFEAGLLFMFKTSKHKY